MTKEFDEFMESKQSQRKLSLMFDFIEMQLEKDIEELTIEKGV